MIKPKPKRTWALVLGILFAALGILGLVTTASGDVNINNLTALILPYGILSIVFFAIRMTGNKGVTYKEKQKNLAEHIANSERMISEINVKISALQNSVKYNEVLFLPEKYRTSQATGRMCEYVQNMRADSLKEAINLYESEYLRVF